MNEESDFLAQFLAPAVAVEKEITYGGVTGKVYFKRISAGQRASLLKGQRVQQRGGERSTIDIDLGETTVGKHRMVLFSCCTADGKPRFKTLQEVQNAESLLIEKLYELASEVNKEVDEEGVDEQGKD